MRFLFTGLVAASFIAAGTLHAQRVSPHETASGTVDGAKISVTYGRPYAKGRKIVGGLVPYGQPWRTGADEATMLVTDKDLMFGNTHVSAGKYTLFTLPGEKSWQLIINKQTGQWGTAYDQKQDLARIPMSVGKTSAPVEQLTIAVADTPSGGELQISWENTLVTAPFSVMK
jgi:Protein of unknown function (DUF2911)